MNVLLALFSAYVSFIVLISIASLMAIALTAFNRRIKRFSFETELRLHYTLILVTILLAVLQPLFPREATIEPIARLWAADSIHTFDASYIKNQGTPSAVLSVTGVKSISANALASISLSVSVIASLFLVAIFRHIRDTKRLHEICRRSIPIRTVGKVQVSCLEGITTPFSFRTSRQAVVVVPSWLLASPASLKIALFHELQHHRQRDTLMEHLCSTLRYVSLPNPLVHFWMGTLNNVQEFACDEALIGRKNVSSKAYVGCLLEVADFALSRREEPVRAPSFALVTGRNKLKRRLEMMKSMANFKRRYFGRHVAAGVALLSSLVLLGTARAAHGWVQDRRISYDDAVAMAATQNAQSEFRVVINEAVLAELNRYLGTPEGRHFVERTIERKKSFDAIVSAGLTKYGVPAELAAVPFVESGYRNLPDSYGKPGWGAGLWMFITETARTYGLRVDSTVDQRLDPVLETDAAMRLLVANRARFGSWELSLLAYNVGERTVQETIDRVGSRDVWTLMKAGAMNDHNYVGKVMAAVLILGNQG